ncbi:hypothetical protein PGTUg99_012904 [Puccinia graminis f. sp. tritici]|uniref:Uncharacterized protein n=1 Tax=Puccinia graminis f. sp. tritici TaxID=56615 RepID=A0A5B0RER3_PUCGR|nr:hypothetical protein PGTUg99_012904 [Puccinia graminis f. sp. tritici]
MVLNVSGIRTTSHNFSRSKIVTILKDRGNRLGFSCPLVKNSPQTNLITPDSTRTSALFLSRLNQESWPYLTIRSRLKIKIIYPQDLSKNSRHTQES